MIDKMTSSFGGATTFNSLFLNKDLTVAHAATFNDQFTVNPTGGNKLVVGGTDDDDAFFTLSKGDNNDVVMSVNDEKLFAPMANIDACTINDSLTVGPDTVNTIQGNTTFTDGQTIFESHAMLEGGMDVSGGDLRLLSSNLLVSNGGTISVTGESNATMMGAVPDGDVSPSHDQLGNGVAPIHFTNEAGIDTVLKPKFGLSRSDYFTRSSDGARFVKKLGYHLSDGGNTQFPEGTIVPKSDASYYVYEHPSMSSQGEIIVQWSGYKDWATKQWIRFTHTTITDLGSVVGNSLQMTDPSDPSASERLQGSLNIAADANVFLIPDLGNADVFKSTHTFTAPHMQETYTRNVIDKAPGQLYYQSAAFDQSGEAKVISIFWRDTTRSWWLYNSDQFGGDLTRSNGDKFVKKSGFYLENGGIVDYPAGTVVSQPDATYYVFESPTAGNSELIVQWKQFKDTNVPHGDQWIHITHVTTTSPTHNTVITTTSGGSNRLAERLLDAAGQTVLTSADHVKGKLDLFSVAATFTSSQGTTFTAEDVSILGGGMASVTATELTRSSGAYINRYGDKLMTTVDPVLPSTSFVTSTLSGIGNFTNTEVAGPLKRMGSFEKKTGHFLSGVDGKTNTADTSIAHHYYHQTNDTATEHRYIIRRDELDVDGGIHKYWSLVNTDFDIGVNTGGNVDVVRDLEYTGSYHLTNIGELIRTKNMGDEEPQHWGRDGEATPGDYEIRYRNLAPNGNAVGPQPQQLTYLPQTGYQLGSNDVVVASPGALYFETGYDGVSASGAPYTRYIMYKPIVVDGPPAWYMATASSFGSLNIASKALMSGGTNATDPFAAEQTVADWYNKSHTHWDGANVGYGRISETAGGLTTLAATNVNGTLTVIGATTLQDTLTVKGAATFHSLLKSSGTGYSLSDAEVNIQADLNVHTGNLKVIEAGVTLDGTLDIGGASFLHLSDTGRKLNTTGDEITVQGAVAAVEADDDNDVAGKDAILAEVKLAIGASAVTVDSAEVVLGPVVRMSDDVEITGDTNVIAVKSDGITLTAATNLVIGGANSYLQLDGSTGIFKTADSALVIDGGTATLKHTNSAGGEVCSVAVASGSVTISGITTIAGTTKITGDLDISAGRIVCNDLLVQGTTTTVNSEDVAFSDNHVHLNAFNEVADATSSGIVTTCKRVSHTYNVVVGNTELGVTTYGISNPSGNGSRAIQPGDIVTFQSANKSDGSSGLYEVDSATTNSVTFVTNTSDSFTKKGTDAEWEAGTAGLTMYTIEVSHLYFNEKDDPNNSNRTHGSILFGHGCKASGSDGEGAMNYTDIMIGDIKHTVTDVNGTVPHTIHNHLTRIAPISGTTGTLFTDADESKLSLPTGAADGSIYKVVNDTNAAQYVNTFKVELNSIASFVMAGGRYFNM